MEINNQLWLSPMEGVSDLGFRKLCHKHGADLTFTPMIRADALVRNNKATLDLIDTHLASVPTGIQLLVSKPQVLKKALEIITKKREENDPIYLNIKCIDLNFGCPSKEIVTRGMGPALLKRTNRMKELLSTLKEFSPVPCGIKIRIGLNKREKNNKIYLNVLKIANEQKLDWITVHPIRVDQTSQDPIDLDALKEIIQNATIPVVGNGFVTTGEKAKYMLDMGCSAVMIARGAIGNPWIFTEIKHFLETGKELDMEKDFEKALGDYFEIAKKYRTKDKVFNFHKKTFLLRQKGDMAYHSPSRIY